MLYSYNGVLHSKREHAIATLNINIKTVGVAKETQCKRRCAHSLLDLIVLVDILGMSFDFGEQSLNANGSGPGCTPREAFSKPACNLSPFDLSSNGTKNFQVMKCKTTL